MWDMFEIFWHPVQTQGKEGKTNKMRTELAEKSWRKNCDMMCCCIFIILFYFYFILFYLLINIICVIVEFDPLFQLSKILRYLYPRHPPAVQTLRSFILGWWMSMSRWELNIIPELCISINKWDFVVLVFFGKFRLDSQLQQYKLDLLHGVC